MSTIFPTTAPSPIPIGTTDQWGRVWDGVMWRCPVGISEAPADGRFYGRQNETWQLGIAAVNGEALGDLTVDGNLFVTKNATVGEKLTVGCLVGVTDGSVAAAGCVGEHLDVQSASLLMPASGVSADYPVLTLPPGDWRVEGEIQLDININLTNLYFSILAGGQTLGRFFLSASAGFGGNYLVFPTRAGHISVATPTAVTGRVYAVYAPPTPETFTIEVVAWRIR